MQWWRSIVRRTSSSSTDPRQEIPPLITSTVYLLCCLSLDHRNKSLDFVSATWIPHYAYSVSFLLPKIWETLSLQTIATKMLSVRSSGKCSSISFAAIAESLLICLFVYCFNIGGRIQASMILGKSSPLQLSGTPNLRWTSEWLWVIQYMAVAATLPYLHLTHGVNFIKW